MQPRPPTAATINHSIAYVSDTVVPVPSAPGQQYGVVRPGQNAGEAVVALDREVLTFSEKAAVAAEIKRRLDAAAGIITTVEPRTAYEMLDRQNQLVQKMNALTNPQNQ